MSDAKVESGKRGLCCHYSVLGVGKQTTATQIREAYRRLALKWHPDRWMKDPKVAGEAKKRFQKIQEANSILSDKGKRTIHEARFFGFLGDGDDEEKSSLEGLKGLLLDMMAENERAMFGFHEWNTCSNDIKRSRTCG